MEYRRRACLNLFIQVEEWRFNFVASAARQWFWAPVGPINISGNEMSAMKPQFKKAGRIKY